MIIGLVMIQSNWASEPVYVCICVALWNVELMSELKLGLIQSQFIIFRA